MRNNPAGQPSADQNYLFTSIISCDNQPDDHITLRL
jgi:hypothetical protein